MTIPLDILPRRARGEAGEVDAVVRAAGPLLLRVPVRSTAQPTKKTKNGNLKTETNEQRRSAKPIRGEAVSVLGSFTSLSRRNFAEV